MPQSRIELCRRSSRRPVTKRVSSPDDAHRRGGFAINVSGQFDHHGVSHARIVLSVLMLGEHSASQSIRAMEQHMRRRQHKGKTVIFHGTEVGEDSSLERYEPGGMRPESCEVGRGAKQQRVPLLQRCVVLLDDERVCHIP